MNKDNINTVLAFVSGDLLATIFSFTFFPEADWLHPLFKLLMAFFIGIFGGAGGLLFKTVYSIIEPKIKSKIESWFK